MITSFEPAEKKAQTMHASNLPLGGMFGETKVGELAVLGRHPEHRLMQKVIIDCPGWPNGHGGRNECSAKAQFECTVFFSEVTACDECVQKYLEAEKIHAYKRAWESICPEGFRDTDLNHPDFPKAQYLQLKGWSGEKSLFFIGDSRTGKSRLAMLALKRCLLSGKSVGVVWPEKLKSTNFAKDTFDLVENLSRYDVLLLDDGLLAAAGSDKVISMLKDLIDVMIRRKRRWIITSQIGGDDMQDPGGNGGNKSTKADKAALEALLKRLREESQVITFVKPVQGEGISQF